MRVVATIATLVGAIALTSVAVVSSSCTAFEAGPTTAAASTDAAATQEGGPSSSSGDAGAGSDGSNPLPSVLSPLPCVAPVTAFEDAFADQTLDKWTAENPSPAGGGITVDDEFLSGQQEAPARDRFMRADFTATEKLQYQNPSTRSIYRPLTATSARLEFLMAVVDVGQYSEIGCVLGITTVKEEMRVYIHTQGNDPTTLQLGADLGAKSADTEIPFLGPLVKRKWMSVIMDVILDPKSGAVISLGIDGKVQGVKGPVDLKEKVTGVRVLCGIMYVDPTTLPVTDEVAIDDVKLSVCP